MSSTGASRVVCVGVFGMGWTLFIVVLYSLLTAPSSPLTATLRHHLLGSPAAQRPALRSPDLHRHRTLQLLQTLKASRPLGLNVQPTTNPLHTEAEPNRLFLAPLPVLLTTAVLPLLMWLAQRRLQAAGCGLAPAAAAHRLLAIADAPRNEVRDSSTSTDDEEANTFRPVLQGANVLFEQDDDGVVLLSYGEGSKLWMGFRSPDSPLDFGLEYFQSQAAIMLCSGPRRRMLMLGLGIGALPVTVRAIHPLTEIDVVEIDPEVIQGTCKLLDLQPDSRLNILQADAAKYVQREDRHGYYDLIFLDCFDEAGIPPIFHRLEFFQDAIRCLAPGGVFTVNVIATLPETPVIRQHLQTLLPRPRRLMCGTTTNCAFFGTTTLEGDAALERGAMLRAALAIDERGVLPYSLTAQVDRVSLI
eukprot:EG_transcript_8871